jgi:protein-S-isoprenylcysteine O-methyltransferase Ste14
MMQALELKIPPPAVALVIAAAMWGISLIVPALEAPVAARAIAGIVLALAGGGVALSGNIALRRASTTINPWKPETASALVTSGIYRYTRNPMYVGLLLLLLGWAAFLSSPFVFLGPVVFVLYISRFQIVPEERALSALFGAAFTDYQSQVRRWL